MEELLPAISKLEQKLESQMRDAAETKKAINLLLKMTGQKARYADIDSAAGGLSVRADEYYGQPLSTVVADVLSRSKAAGGGALTVNEIYDAMVRGGYSFDTKSDDNAKRGLRISLTKNSGSTGKFHRVPGGAWGLREWYPNIPNAKADRPQTNGVNGASAEEDNQAAEADVDLDTDSENEQATPKE